ncbi:EI24 domain-containing protein [Oscillatoria sp. FACHB-1406]|uniref:EI24 domain-containing protein n=1 Tax=Oscillatoria sp. FACHB-1406 TaxID=2692846 RepID=UPI001689748E|nr:EI24 domain-containing protein [Oscillatoria sp. FACHB-1406]MBD2578092.1 EI24 domain-containing protein [Oscillatoria sp. FACHB-1406]
MICGLLAGASYPLRAIRLFQKAPRLLGFLIVPILLNAVIGTVLYAGLLFPSWQGLTSLTQLLDLKFDAWVANRAAWLHYFDYAILALGWLLRALLVPILLLITGFIFLQFGSILGAPWYGKLSEQIEEFQLGRVEIVEVNIFQDIGRALLFEVKKIGLWLAIGLPLLLLNFIPGLGTAIATAGGITLTAMIACLDFLDGPSERRRFSFRKKLSLVFQTFPASVSFSALCWLLSSIPLVNLVTIPICVASGTLFWCDRVLPKLSPVRSARLSNPSLES